jgi:hypothetical protein
MSEELNPYKSPQEAQPADAPSRPAVYFPLATPAIALLFGSLTWLAPQALFYYIVIEFKIHQRGTIAGELADAFDQFWFLYLASLLCECAVIYGAVQMLRRRQHRACVTGALAACIPFLSPCYGLSIPFGLWALVILLRKETRAAFTESIQAS